MILTNLEFVDYSTGLYGPKNNFEGLTLQFIDKDTGSDYFVVFNANLRRKRNKGSHLKGSLLPPKRFSVGKKCKFFRFWLYRCELPIPARGLTTFHDCMGKLKKFQFQARVQSGNKLDKDSLMPVESVEFIDFPAKSLMATRERPDKDLIPVPDKSSVQSYDGYEFEQIVGEGEYKCDTSKQVDTFTSNPIGPLDETRRVQMQTNEEWLSECGEH